MFFIGAGDLDFDRVLSVAAAGLVCRLYAKGTRLARLLWLDEKGGGPGGGRQRLRLMMMTVGYSSTYYYSVAAGTGRGRRVVVDGKKRMCLGRQKCICVTPGMAPTTVKFDYNRATEAAIDPRSRGRVHVGV